MEAVRPHNRYLLNGDRETQVSQTTGAKHLLPAGMIVKSADTPHPILVLQSTLLLHCSICHQIIHLRTRENLLHGLNTKGRVVAINGIIPQYLVQARVGVEVAAVA